MNCYCYHTRYQLSNGETRAENGYPKVVGEQQIPVISISGKYSFVGTDGVTYWVHYTADENGYHPVVGKLKYYFSEQISDNLLMNDLSGTGAEPANNFGATQ